MRKSVFSVQYWLDKGLTNEEAKYQIQIRRPNNYLYWVNKGYSEEEAHEKLKKFQKDANKDRTPSSFREGSKRCLEYYIKRGYDEVFAKQEIAKIQSTFSLEKCKKKYGAKKGKQIWKERQNKWQNTIQNKSEEEKRRINEKKNVLDINKLRQKFASDQDIQKFLFETRKIKLYLTIDDFSSYLKRLVFENPDYYYSSAERIAGILPKIQFQLLNITDPISFLREFLSKDDQVTYKSTSRGSYRKWIGTRLLRSSYEILFHELLCEKSIECEIDGKYPNSSMRYDFYLPKYKQYIEIAPCYDLSEKYKIKMNKKRKLFGCVILKNTDDFVAFISSLNEG